MARPSLRRCGQSLSAGEVAALVLDLADADERSLVNAVKLIAPVAQAKGTAVLVAERPEIVARGRRGWGASSAIRAGLMPRSIC